MDIFQKMKSGARYDASHPKLIVELERIREKIWEYNNLRPSQKEEQREILKDILGGYGERFHFNQPFHCDYGSNIYIGENFFANFNLTILDEAEVRIGNNCFIGPNVSIYTACHPLDAKGRNELIEWSEPVTIGDNVWIGGSVTIVPGVRIGNNAVIGAGSTVTRDIPDNVMAAGNPARVIKELN